MRPAIISRATDDISRPADIQLAFGPEPVIQYHDHAMHFTNIEIEASDVSFDILIETRPPKEPATPRQGSQAKPRELGGTLPHRCPIRWRDVDRILRARPSTTPAATKSTRLAVSRIRATAPATSFPEPGSIRLYPSVRALLPAANPLAD